MKDLNRILKPNNLFHIFVGSLLIIFIISNIQLPNELTSFINTTFGNIVVIILAVILLLTTHPVVGILGIVAAYELIRRSTGGLHLFYNQDTLIHKQEFIPETNRYNLYPRYNDFPITLEEEMVDKMAPLVKHDSPSNLNYKPHLCNTLNASSFDA